MKIISQSFELCDPALDGQEILKHIERCGRVCYKSEEMAAPGTSEDFVRRIIRRGHESVLEHVSVSARIVTDRGVTHEIVRHRLASYSQESTRYCNYDSGRFGRQITVIRPCYWPPESRAAICWEAACRQAEEAYFELRGWGCAPQEARAVLPNSLKAELIMTANLREWRHFFRLRCSPAAHPQMRELATRGLELMRAKIPVVFDDVAEEVLSK